MPNYLRTVKNQWWIQIWHFDLNCHQYVQMKSEERYSEYPQTDGCKHSGGSAMFEVWVSSSVLGDLVKTNGSMNVERYPQILSWIDLPRLGSLHHQSSVWSSGIKATKTQTGALECSSNMENIPEDLWTKLQQSLSKTFLAVLENKGGHTNYWISSALEWVAQNFCMAL